MMDTIIEVKNLAKRYFFTSPMVLKNVSLDVVGGEFLCFVGPSGCGKSTLIRLIAGLEKPTAGKVFYKKTIVKKVNPEISMVFQSFALLPWLTVKENVEFGAKMSGGIDWAEEHWVRGSLFTVGLNKVFDMYPRELSGGMRQRVGIARALVMDPKVLILDEPFSQLDLITANELRSEILDIWQSRSLTVIMVSHSIEEAVQLADRIVVMDAGEIKKIVPVNLRRPRHKGSQEFLEAVGEIEGIMGLKNGD